MSPENFRRRVAATVIAVAVLLVLLFALSDIKFGP